MNAANLLGRLVGAMASLLGTSTSIAVVAVAVIAAVAVWRWRR